jgi:hypothetical protein
MIHRLGNRLAVLALACSLTVAGCLPSGDPGWSAEVQNLSGQPVLIAVDDLGTTNVYYAPPGSAGISYQTLGVAKRALRVLDPDCTVRATLEVADVGSYLVTIAPDGSSAASLNQKPSDIGGSLRTLSGVCGAHHTCADHDLPWPSDILGPPGDAYVGC